MPNKYLFALQMWRGDRIEGESLALLIAKVCLKAYGGPSPDYDFLFSYRWDTEINMSVVEKVGRAFSNVHTFRGESKDKGWPRGPNAQALETYHYFVGQKNRGRWNYDMIQLAEPDSVPLTCDFLAQIADEWRRANKHILGAVVCDDGGIHHANGNLCASSSYICVNPAFTAGAVDAGWDVVHRKNILAHCCPSRTIYSDYASQDADCDRLFAPRQLHPLHPYAHEGPQRPVWVHGTKRRMEVQACVRARLLEGKSPTISVPEHAPLPFVNWPTEDPMVPLGR